MSNNHGVTMTEMVVVIIIILMIAIFAISSGTETLNQVDATEVYVEMKSMKDAVNSVIMKQNLNDNFVLEKGKYYDTEFYPASSVEYGTDVTSDAENWYIIYGVDEEAAFSISNVKDYLGLDSINHTYIVNFSTADVELYKPLKVANAYVVRTFEEVRSLVEEGKI